MKRIFIALVLPAALVLGSLGLGVTLASGPAGAAEHAHATMQHSWHGTISKTYVVHWDAMTHFTMGTAKNIKVGALVTVTGTLKGMTIAGTKLDV
jgi:hypothetical protein